MKSTRAVVRRAWSGIRGDVRAAAWLFPTVALIYLVLYPLMEFPGRHR